ncbi:hypothetical protein [Mongoliitalea daihaiensis]|uniref:hypothetical protein n=1 Tax=Mongoliitalea daihaiensis TaxID=2782006 RepID=UPI001F3AED44|nr:hypothetical protein [Mongoliitalea daihaiensis]UJP65697.1 hypothetical protein IPZ59_03470 [Mongoliitalea daihaiensis]
MKKLLIIPMLFLGSILFAQSIEGAWKLTHQNGQEITNAEYIKLIQDGYFAFGAKLMDGDKFLGAGGGDIKIEGNQYIETLDFYTLDPESVGTTVSYGFELKDDQLLLSKTIDGQPVQEVWRKIGTRNDALTANWVFTGRKSEGEIRRSTPGDRRTVKILTGGRFQWIAFNSATKEFMGTGGGTYAAENGKYIESITFFSRDDSRVGASLSFDFEVIDNEWHHSGLSSTGNPIYEIWSKYRDAYTPSK